MKVLGVDPAAAVAQCVSKEFGEAACAVLAAGAPDGDVAGASGEVGVVGEIGDEFDGAGGADDILDAGVEAVDIEDFAAGSRSRSRMSSMRSACGGTGRPSVTWGERR